MREASCNGWSNYATWRVNLEICSDLAEMMEQDRETFQSVDDLADRFKEDVENVITNYGEDGGLAVQYAWAFLTNVDYNEIAQAYADDLVEWEEEDEDPEN